MMKTRIETRGCSLLPFIANFLYATSARFEQRFQHFVYKRVRRTSIAAIATTYWCRRARRAQ
eukprot:COSAG02_NODE_2363_length_9059_cov_7.474219_10_plen_62_part_00